MNRYQLKRFIRYRLKAKTRHGVHSPFVFDFIERGLRANDSLPLLQKITHYFQQYQLVIIEDLSLENIQKINALLDKTDPDQVIIIKKIHRNDLFSKNWELLHKHEKVTLSIELYNYGLLFFKKEFLVKQHFILKYPA